MVPLPWQCVLWGCLLTAVHLGQCGQCGDKQYVYQGQCCDLCQPGKRLVNHCTASVKTQCLSCGSGEFVSDWNRETHCLQHKHCEPNEGLQVEKEGTTDTDTTCACKEGRHCVGDKCERCALHKSCDPGFGVEHLGNGTRDTVCEPCPVGFFSNESSPSKKCQPWTSCEAKGLVVLQEGTDQTDAVCGTQPRMRALLVIPIMMGVLITIFLVSLYIKKVVKKPRDKEALPTNIMRQDPVESEDFPGHNTGAPVQETLHGCQPVTQEDGKESRISVQERHVTGSMDLTPLVGDPGATTVRKA